MYSTSISFYIYDRTSLIWYLSELAYFQIIFINILNDYYLCIDFLIYYQLSVKYFPC